MEKVKSKYILKSLLSLIKNKLLLSLLSYNKNLQTKLDITLQDYKNASNVYITKEKDNTKNI